MVYKAHHLEIAPGHPDGDTTAAPTEQAIMSSNAGSQTAAVGTPGFNRGHYL